MLGKLRLCCLVAPIAVVAACASGRMGDHGSAREHEKAARANEDLADAHDAASTQAEPCVDVDDFYAICWTDSDTPEAHRELADRHRRIAATHAASAEALRQAEEAACAGVAQVDRERSPFLRSADVVRAELLDPSSGESEEEIPVLRVTFADVPGLDVARLQRVVDCHLARNVALGNDVPEMEYCPLVPKGVTATASRLDARIAVTVAADQANFADVRRRAELLAQRTLKSPPR